MDVKATRAIRQAEVGAAKTMIARTEERFGIKPAYLAADTAYGSADTLNWIVNEKKIAPHIPVIDKSKRVDGTFSREDFRFDEEQNINICPTGKKLTTTGHVGPDSRDPLPGLTARMQCVRAQTKMLSEYAFPPDRARRERACSRRCSCAGQES
jgi:hypothetical protein